MGWVLADQAGVKERGSENRCMSFEPGRHPGDIRFAEPDALFNRRAMGLSSATSVNLGSAWAFKTASEDKAASSPSASRIESASPAPMTDGDRRRLTGPSFSERPNVRSLS